MQGPQESPLPLVTLADYGLTPEDLLASLQPEERACAWCLKELGLLDHPSQNNKSHGSCYKHRMHVWDQLQKRKAEKAAKAKAS